MTARKDHDYSVARSATHHPDWWLLLTAVALLFLGVFVVFDSSYARAAQSAVTGRDSFYFLKRQALWAVLGLIALAVGMRVPYWRLKGYWPALLVIAAASLVIVLIPGIGIERNGSRRWLGAGMITVQPSEFAKFALVLFIAAYGAVRKAGVRDPIFGLAPILLVTSGLGGLVAVEDLGTGASLVFTGLIMAYLTGARKRYLLAFCTLGVLAFLVFVFHKEYRVQRVMAFMSPWSYYDGAGYQPAQSLVALGSGGITGRGIAKGNQKFLYLPAEHTDYIFATVGEEMGLVGSIGLLAALCFLVIRGLTVAHRTNDRFGSLLAAGLSCMIAVQSLMNVAVVTSSIPATGVPLPFISYGGSALVFTMLSVGMMLSVSQYPNGRAVGERVRESDRDRGWDRRASLSGY
jgi:cell division protein FtsW